MIIFRWDKNLIITYLSLIFTLMDFITNSAIANGKIFKDEELQCFYDLRKQMHRNTPHIQPFAPGRSEARFIVNNGGRISDIEVTATNSQITSLTYKIITSLHGRRDCKKQ